MKKIVFLVIASLMVMGLVLPGCGGGGGGGAWTPTLWVAVVGPLTDLQGQNHLGGAQMAMDEINAAGGVNVNGTSYRIGLVQVETQEQTTPTPALGTANLLAAFSANPNITFCVGGFRTEAVSGYRDVAMDAQKLFMNCGAATGSLQFSVVTNYSKYKYWFKSTPYNESFLVKSLFKMNAIVSAVLNGTLYVANATLKPAYQNFTMQRVAIFMENAAWCAGMVAAAQAYLPLMGFHVVGTWLVSPTGVAADVDPILTAIKATDPHIIFTAFSGSVGAVYSIRKAALAVPGMTLGINVPAQQLLHYANTGGACLGEVILDTWAENLSSGTGTVAWFNNYVTRFGRYPVYTAATYDAIKLVSRAVDQTNSFNSNDLVTWLENPANAMTDSVASPKIGQFPAPAITVAPGSVYALSDAQVYALYPNINSSFIRFNTTSPYFHPASGYWMYDWLCHNTTAYGPNIQHDLLYGPGLVTGVGAQWQNISGAGKKMGIWPKYMGPTSPPFKLVDQYGDWNFQYPGTVGIVIPVNLFQ